MDYSEVVIEKMRSKYGEHGGVGIELSEPFSLNN
jgi:hypothetical protein